MKGRKPTLDAMKRARGTAQPVRLRGEIEGLEVTSVDQIEELCNSSLLSSALQKRVFREKCEQLIQLGQLKATDIDLLVVYAKAMDDYISASKAVKKDGLYITLYDEEKNPSKIVVNPYKAVMDRAGDTLMKLSSVFGFSPVDRLKLKVEMKKEESLGDVLANLLK